MIVMGGVCGMGVVMCRLFVEEGVCVVIGDVFDVEGEVFVCEFGDVVCFVWFDVVDEVSWLCVVEVVVE